jgi:hypothetical protein
MDTWRFYQNAKRQWCWEHVSADGNKKGGKQCFDSRTDCIADAMRNGYLTRTLRRDHCLSPGRSTLVARPQPTAQDRHEVRF